MMEQMKPSGVDWIGDIPVSWSINRLKFMLANEEDSLKVGPFGSSLSGTDYIPEGKWVFNQRVVLDNNFIDNDTCISDEKFQEMKSFSVYPGDILITTRGTIGKVAIVPQTAPQGILHPCIIKFRLNKKLLLPELLKLLFNETSYAQEQFAFMNNSTTIDVIYSYSLKDIILPLIPINEQKAIYAFLHKECAQIDSIAADLEKQIALLQQYKKSLITEIVTKGLDKSVPMKDSGVEWLGKIPAHWNFKRLKFMLENSSDSMKVGPFGSTLSGSDFTDEGKWVYNQRVVLDNNFSENTTFVSEEKFQEMRSFAVYPGDILITTRGTIGKVAIVPEGANEGILHPCIIKFRVDKEMIIPELLQLIFNESDFVKDQFTLMSNATTIEVIYSYSLKDILLPVIPADEQEKIYGYLSKKCIAIDGIISEKQKALATIIQHKKSLIYEYVTGKKRVKEVR